MDHAKTSLPSSPSAVSLSIPASSLQPYGMLRLAIGICLCLSAALVGAAPADTSSRTMVRRDVLEDPLVDVLDTRQSSTLLDYLRTVLAFRQQPVDRRPSTASFEDFGLSGAENFRPIKRGFGIAGLDNVDMITSTLDRSRAMSRSRSSPMMSSGLTLKQLRALMERAG